MSNNDSNDLYSMHINSTLPFFIDILHQALLYDQPKPSLAYLVLKPSQCAMG